MPDPTSTLNKIRKMIKEETGTDPGAPPSMLQRVLSRLIPPRRAVISEGKVVAHTRFEWWHLNFGGWKGWRQAEEKALQEQVTPYWHIIGRFFGHLVVLDDGKDQCWIIPRVQIPGKIPEEGKVFMIRIGWLYWAVGVSKSTWYPNPRRYMPGFDKLPYASEALAARYYLHDHQEGGA